jgi:hypothetical protein
MRRAAPQLQVSWRTTGTQGVLVSLRMCAAASAKATPEGGQQQESAKGTSASATSLASAEEGEQVKPRNIRIYSNTTKGVYIHFHNRLAAIYWWKTDFHFWLMGFIIALVGSQLLVRYRVSLMSTVQQARLGENLLDQRTRDLLSDVETLREKDPLRLESEANAFHELFWNLRAKKIAESRAEARTTEINRGVMQAEARGTDMSEWLGAKKKDDSEREIARRTHDYIQGFHQHLKSKRLI